MPSDVRPTDGRLDWAKGRSCRALEGAHRGSGDPGARLPSSARTRPILVGPSTRIAIPAKQRPKSGSGTEQKGAMPSVAEFARSATDYARDRAPRSQLKVERDENEKILRRVVGSARVDLPVSLSLSLCALYLHIVYEGLAYLYDVHRQVHIALSAVATPGWLYFSHRARVLATLAAG